MVELSKKVACADGSHTWSISEDYVANWMSYETGCIVRCNGDIQSFARQRLSQFDLFPLYESFWKSVAMQKSFVLSSIPARFDQCAALEVLMIENSFFSAWFTTRKMWLLQAHKICGHRLFFLLLDGDCPIEEPEWPMTFKYL